MTQVRTVPASHGTRLEVSHVVAEPPAAAWDLLVDTHRWPDWGPTITGVEATDRRIRTGTTGRIQLAAGPWLPFEITDCDPEARSWTWNVACVPATCHRVETLGEERCRIVFELPTVAAGYVPVCLRALEALADCLEEGV
ncbi:SRPBCC family protein [Natrialbaceae archaeon AArc-T1-2]|uniref:SRPBCC family protein n=1 Tax=Natrialbaceae archaeon AArc-T1-2 TaxID=3053904 RepID=UPI00255B3E81|nr:SRPBCC family protein [Natrialbaceae archaeon AArc-T1-2]WIV66264.1 SRPBCC family protein [Natrialbaceae archaeon AArc-T1-2]